MAPALIEGAEKSAQPDAKTTSQFTRQSKTTHQNTAPKKAGFSAEQLRSLVQETLARNSFYSPGFLIARRDVEPIFSKLLEKGITKPDDQEDLVDLVLADHSFLVKLLKTPDGRAFMKKLGNDPSAYDRLERLSWTFDGRKVIERIVADRDGVKILKQLNTPEELAKFSKQLAADPRTKDFHMPTGKGHTADEFVERVA